MSLRTWLLLGLLAALAAGLSAVSLGLFSFGIGASIWPANAIVLAFLIRGFSGFRGKSMALGVATLAFAATNLAFGHSPIVSAAFAMANALEIGLVTWVLRNVRMPMSDAADYISFAAAAVFAGPLLSGLAATATALAVGAVEAQAALGFLRSWVVADALGMAVVAPFALSVGAGGFRLPEGRVLFRSALAQALVLVFALAACLPLQQPFPFSVFIFPAVAIAVFVGRDTAGLLAIATVAAVLVGGAALGLGPAARASQIGADGMLMVQCLLAALVATVHPLSAVLRRLDGYAAEAEARRRQAEQLSASKTRLLSEVSEELRSPLTGVLTVAEILQSGRLGPLSEHQRRLLERMRESGAEIELLSRKMRDAAAIQAGAAKLSPDRVNLSALMVGAITAARFKTRDYNCEFRLGACDTSLEVFADQSRLRQSLIALLVAAARYSGRSGQVQVSAFEHGEGRVRIIIEDSGDGVPAQRLRELYTASPDAAGVGIGLGMTRDFIRLQGGDLGLEPGSLGGARVWLDLPTGRAPHARAA